MNVLLALLLASVTQVAALLTEARQLVGLAAAVLAALLSARLGWYGTDRLIAWRSRADD